MNEPQMHLNGKPQKWARGRVIGGSSSINGNLFVRGDPKEYDSWRDTKGCSGWGYSDMLPIFKRLEDYPEGDPAVRGRGGPIHCTKLDKFDALSDAFWPRAVKLVSAAQRLQRRQLRRRVLPASTRRAMGCATARRSAICDRLSIVPT
jgi:choline dehydrogenase-like flavoprotein